MKLCIIKKRQVIIGEEDLINSIFGCLDERKNKAISQYYPSKIELKRLQLMYKFLLKLISQIVRELVIPGEGTLIKSDKWGAYWDVRNNRSKLE